MPPRQVEAGATQLVSLVPQETGGAKGQEYHRYAKGRIGMPKKATGTSGTQRKPLVVWYPMRKKATGTTGTQKQGTS